MRRRKIVWWTFGVALFCGFVLAGVVAYRKGIPPEPPFAQSDGHVFSAIYMAYDYDEIEADKHFKGKVLRLHDVHSSHICTDDVGEKYISVFRLVDHTKHPIREEAIRCYLHRPENPVMKTDTHLPFGVQGHDIEGVCMGKIDGIVVMRKCYLVEVSIEGADW